MQTSSSKSEVPTNPTGVKFIVASWYKNRTKTTANVFKTLGYKVYDFDENQVFNCKQWLEFVDNDSLTKEQRLQLLRDMHKDVDVIVDLPAHLFWRELLEAFPEAKVVFYARGEAGWVTSAFRQTEMTVKLMRIPDEIKGLFLRIFAPQSYVLHLWFIKFCGLTQAGDFYGFKTLYNGGFKFNKLLSASKFRQHNADVLQNCPKEKLLHLKDDTFNWETICEFLGVDIPKDSEGKVKEFPHMNKKGKFIDDYVATESPQNLLLKQELRASFLKFGLSILGVGVAIGYKFYFMSQ